MDTTFQTKAFKPLTGATDLRCLFIVLILSMSAYSSKVMAQNLEWMKQIEGTGMSDVYSIHRDSAGFLYVSGMFNDTVDIDPGPGVFQLIQPSMDEASFLAKYSTDGLFIWGIKTTIFFNFVVEDNGVVYYWGGFSGTVDFDPGTGVLNLTSAGSGPDGFITKLDSSGNLLWAQQVSGSKYETFGAGMLDMTGNLVISGQAENGTVLDLDPGPGTFTISVGGTYGYENFLASYSTSGTFLWANQYSPVGSPGGGGFTELTHTPSGNILAAGNYTGNLDFDHGPGLDTLSGHHDIFLLLLSPSGAFKWVKGAGNSFIANSVLTSIATDNDGNIYGTGSVAGTLDFDFGPGVYYVSSAGLDDMFMVKWDSTGAVQWLVKSSHPSTLGIEYGKSVYCDSDNNVYFTGILFEEIDADPGPGIYTITNPSLSWSHFSYLVSYSPSGAVRFSIEGYATSWDNFRLNQVIHAGGDKLYVSGSLSGTADLDPGSSVLASTSLGTGRDGILWKFSMDSCSTLLSSFTTATDWDCAADSGYAEVSVSGGIPPYTYAWSGSPSTGSLASFASGGPHTVTVTDGAGCISVRTVLVPEPLDTSGFDLEPFLVGHSISSSTATPVVAGMTNSSCVSTPGILRLVLDPHPDLLYIGAVPAPSLIAGDTLEWNVASLSFDSSDFSAVVWLQTLPSFPSWGSFLFEVTALPFAGDVDTTNNHKKYSLGSLFPYDPNYKQASPGICLPNYIQLGTEHEYAVHFQNIGSAPAVNVAIYDTLDLNLESGTVEVVASSHPLVVEYPAPNVLKFFFPGIHLPHASADSLGSQGYVVFHIRHDSLAPLGTEIRNTAAIYFDSNPAIITNEVFQTLADPLPVPYTEVFDTISVCFGEDYTFPDGTTVSGITSPFSQLSYSYTSESCDHIIETYVNVIAPDTTVSASSGTLTAAPGAATYQWLDCDDSFAPVAGATSAVFKPSLTGNYAVLVSQGGCSDTSRCHYVIAVSIDEISGQSNFIAYPNPVTGSCEIRAGAGMQTLSVINALGQEILVHHFHGETHITLDMSALPAGPYFIRVKSDGKWGSQKVMKE